MRIENGTRPLAEVPLQHRRGGHCIQARELPAADIKLVEVDEEERLVVAVENLGNPDRTAQGEAKFVLVPKRFYRCEEAARIEMVIIGELEGSPVDLIGAAFHVKAGYAAKGV